MKTKNTSLLPVLTHLMNKTIADTPMSILYNDLDIFNIYRSGLCSMSLKDNLESYFKSDTEKYDRIDILIKELSPDDLETIDEFHSEIYSEIFNKHKEDVDSRILKFIQTGEEDSLPEGFKKSVKYSFDNSKDLVELYQEKHGKTFKTLDEVYNFCEEESFDTYENLYDCDSFNPSKYYILERLDEISLKGINHHLQIIREEKLNLLLPAQLPVN